MIYITTIVIKNSDLFTNSEKVENLKKFLVTCLESYELTLDLSSLIEIIITGLLVDDVTDYQRINGLRIIGATNTEHEKAVAKVMNHKDGNGELKQTVFISDYIADLFFSESAFKFANHVLHHELCHVHENYHSDKIYTDEGKSGKYISELSHILNVNSEIIWCEYYVERLSVSTIDFDNVVTYTNHLIQLLERTQNEMIEIISDYRTNDDIWLLFREVQERSSILMKVAGTLIGVLHGVQVHAGESEETIFSLIDTKILEEHNYFYTTWKMMRVELDKLFNKYPNWNDIYELEALGQVVLICWNTLGVYPIEGEEEFYVDVPF